MDFGAILVIVFAVLLFIVLPGYIGHRVHEERRKQRKIRDVAYREALRREKELDCEQQEEEQRRKQS